MTCRGCNAPDHALPSCDTEAAALEWERRGKPRQAARVRRHMEELRKAQLNGMSLRERAESRKV